MVTLNMSIAINLMTRVMVSLSRQFELPFAEYQLVCIGRCTRLHTSLCMLRAVEVIVLAMPVVVVVVVVVEEWKSSSAN